VERYNERAKENGKRWFEHYIQRADRNKFMASTLNNREHKVRVCNILSKPAFWNSKFWRFASNYIERSTFSFKR
jgi:hypothetical protein